jgi:hypothetical protein
MQIRGDLINLIDMNEYRGVLTVNSLIRRIESVMLLERRESA